MRISDWSSDVCSSDLPEGQPRAAHLLLSDPVVDVQRQAGAGDVAVVERAQLVEALAQVEALVAELAIGVAGAAGQFVVVFPQARFAQRHRRRGNVQQDRKSTRLNSSH